MTNLFSEHSVHVNNIDLHYIEYANKKSVMLLMHGLTANAHAFDGLIHAGLCDHFHLYSVDFRGRGLSAKTAFAYSIKHHADDIIALLDHLRIEHIILCGHSFGGLLASYLAYHYPQRFRKIIILDAAPQMNSRSAEMLGPALARLDKRYPDFENYLSEIRNSPYLNFWHDDMYSYYKADVDTASDGSVEPRSNLNDIVQVAVAVSKEPWSTYFEEIDQPVLLVNAVENYTMEMPLLPVSRAKETVAAMKKGSYVAMKGNHQTMLYGEHAITLVNEILDFLK